jgi:uncharacterized protein YejL (UPF0352 family)
VGNVSPKHCVGAADLTLLTDGNQISNRLATQIASRTQTIHKKKHAIEKITVNAYSPKYCVGNI